MLDCVRALFNNESNVGAAPWLVYKSGRQKDRLINVSRIHSPGEAYGTTPDGTQLQLALNNNPAAKSYQQAIFQQGQPAAMFFTDDVKGDYERIKARGAEFTMPPTAVTGSTIAMPNDTCGNLIQLTQLARY
jgi:hypothetical protein